MTDQASIKENSNPALTWAVVAAIALITFFVFSPSLKNGFTNWDDNDFVTKNPLVVTHSVPVAKIFESPVENSYVPLTVATLALNYQAGKLTPFFYHLENVLLHVLNTILVFLFIFLLTRRNLLMATVVSLFFGIHPMHVESVAWITERKDVLYVFFFMAGLITYLRFGETKKAGWFIFTILLSILSCLSKEMAIVFPVILMLIDYLRDAKWSKELLVQKIPFFIISLFFGIIIIKTHHSSLTVSAIKNVTLFHRLLFASYGAIIYIVKLFVPYKLSAFYPTPFTPDYRGNLLLFYSSPVILLAILIALVYCFKKKKKEIVFGLFFYFVSIVLVDQFVPINPDLTPDRYSYLSYIGLLFVVAYLINIVWQNRKGILKYGIALIVFIAAILFGFQSYSRTQVWKNSEVLWTDAIDNYPTTLAYKARGDYYYSINEPDKAVNDFTTAIALDSTYKYNYNNRGLLYLNTGRPGLALTDFNKAIALDPTYAEAYINRGLLYLNNGKNSLAKADFNKAITLDSTYAEAYVNRGLIYFNEGKNDSALADFNKAITLDPAYASAYNKRGLFYFRTGKNDLALADFNKAVALDPAFENAYNNLGLFYFKTGNANLAIENFGKVIALDSKNVDAYSNQGGLYYLNGKNDSALADFTKAIALNPTSISNYFSRGCCYRKLNQFDKAIADFTTGIQLNPNDADNYNMRGVCELNLNQYTEAIIDFSKAIALNPMMPYYWENRSSAESKTGQLALANADARKAQELQQK